MDGGFVAVSLEGCHGVGAEEGETFLAALAADFDDIVAGVDVGDVEVDEFVDAEAGAVEGFEDGGVACGAPFGGALVFGEGEWEGEEFLDLAECQDDREGTGGFGELDVVERAEGEGVAADEESVEAAECGEVEADGGAAEGGLHEREEP